MTGKRDHVVLNQITGATSRRTKVMDKMEKLQSYDTKSQSYDAKILCTLCITTLRLRIVTVGLHIAFVNFASQLCDYSLYHHNSNTKHRCAVHTHDGHTRSHTVTHGHTRSHTVTHGHTRSHTVTHGHTRSHTVTHFTSGYHKKKKTVAEAGDNKVLLTSSRTPLRGIAASPCWSPSAP